MTVEGRQAAQVWKVAARAARERERQVLTIPYSATCTARYSGFECAQDFCVNQVVPRFTRPEFIFGARYFFVYNMFLYKGECK